MNDNLIPIIETIDLGEKYSCSRRLFSFVNRSLNLYELQASVEAIDHDMVIFTVTKRIKPPA